MDNILYIGPYREFSGVGNASRAYLKSLIRTGHNISARPIYNIYKDYPESELDDEILELETNFSKKYHKIIQHCYPHQLTYNKNFDKHIAIIHFDSRGYRSNVFQFFDIMDTVIVGSDYVNKQIKNKINANVITIPEPIDIDSIGAYKSRNTKQSKNSYNFYCIGDWIKRKNFDKIIFAFIKLSSYYPDIELVIKTKSGITDDTSIKSIIEYDLNKIYDLTKRYNSIKPKIVIGELGTEGLYYIHNNNDCLVNLASGESFGYSTLEAMAFENNIIVNAKTSNQEIIQNGCGLLVDTESTRCMDDNKLFPIYNTFDNIWEDPIIGDIYKKMQYSLNETSSEAANRKNKQKQNLTKYSIENISQLFLNI